MLCLCSWGFKTPITGVDNVREISAVIFSLSFSLCVSVQLRESERFIVGMYCLCLPLSLTVCRANTETEWCILLNRRSRQQSCQCGDAVSFSTVKELKHVPYKPQLTWGEEVSVFLPEKCFCANVCCLCVVTPLWFGTVGRTGLSIYCISAKVQEQTSISNTLTHNGNVQDAIILLERKLSDTCTVHSVQIYFQITKFRPTKTLNFMS